MPKLSLEGRNILVVEDDYFIAQHICSDLEEAGADVIGPVPSVDKALQLMGEGAAIDAAVLDVNLGPEKSFPIAQALAASGVPFLFSTSYNAADIPAEWRHARVVMKPLKIGAVAELLSAGDLG